MPPGEVVQAAGHGGSRTAPRAAAGKGLRSGSSSGKASGRVAAAVRFCTMGGGATLARPRGRFRCRRCRCLCRPLQQHRSGLWLCRSQRRQRDQKSRALGRRPAALSRLPRDAGAAGLRHRDGVEGYWRRRIAAGAQKGSTRSSPPRHGDKAGQDALQCCVVSVYRDLVFHHHRFPSSSAWDHRAVLKGVDEGSGEYSYKGLILLAGIRQIAGITKSHPHPRGPSAAPPLTLYPLPFFSVLDGEQRAHRIPHDTAHPAFDCALRSTFSDGRRQRETQRRGAVQQEDQRQAHADHGDGAEQPDLAEIPLRPDRSVRRENSAKAPNSSWWATSRKAKRLLPKWMPKAAPRLPVR